MEFVTALQSPELQLASLIGRQGVEHLKAKLNHAITGRKSNPPPLTLDAPGQSPQSSARKPKSKLNASFNHPHLPGDAPSAYSKMNYSFDIPQRRDESPDNSYLSVKEGAAGFLYSPAGGAGEAATDLNVMLLQQLQRNSVEPEGGERASASGFRSGGLSSPTERAKVAKKLRILDKRPEVPKSKRKSGGGRANPRLAQISKKIEGFPSHSERTSGKPGV